MPRGVPHFSGYRLRQARHLRRISSQRALAAELALSSEIVSRYERDEAAPTAPVLQKIADHLSFPPSFFLDSPDTDVVASPIYFRSLRKALDEQRDRATVILELLNELATFVERYVDIPDPAIPDWNRLGRIEVFSSERIEEAACRIRSVFGVESGPMPNLTTLMENRGVVISKLHLAPTELDGLSQWRNDHAFVLLNNTKSNARSRFDLAHELGHLVLHRYVEQVYLRDTKAFKQLESQAHYFAGALLLPADEFAHDVWSGTLEEFLSLKSKWQVSAQAMAKRAENLQLISHEHYVRLMKSFSARGWRNEEPMEDVVEAETPSLMARALELILESFPDGQGIITREIHAGASLIAELTGLEPTLLDKTASKVVMLRRR